MTSIEKAGKLLSESIGASTDPGPLDQIDDMEEPGLGLGQGYPDSKSTRKSALIELDEALLASNGLLAPRSHDELLADQFRRIKQPLLRTISSSKDSELHKNLVMVTSSLENEGKTYVAVNLALSIAMELDSTALLVDLDHTKRSVCDHLGVSCKLGVSDYLTKEGVDISEIIYSTNIDGFKFIPAGDQGVINAEMFTSAKMKSFLSELSFRYHDRVIVLDTPPLLSSSVSKALVYISGLVLMVVEAEKTSAKKISDALALVDSSRFAGFVLNKTNIARSEVSIYGASD